MINASITVLMEWGHFDLTKNRKMRSAGYRFVLHYYCDNFYISDI